MRKHNTAIILILLAVGIFYIFTRGQYSEMKEMYALTNEYQSILKNISEIVDLRDRLVATYSTFPEEQIDLLNVVLPDKVDTVQLALDLDNLASVYDISIKNLQTTISGTTASSAIVLPDQAKSYGKALVTFSFVSSYADFTSFLAEMEKSLRIIDVSSISFQSTDSGLYEYKISAETYWLK